MKKTYELLTIEEKAAIAAKLLDNGYNDHGDTCKLDETNHYTFVTSGGEFSAYQTPAELLNDFIEFYGEKPLKEEYNK